MAEINSYLVTGGCRSGKSSFALELAKSAEKPFYIATGWAGDEEMAERIRQHQQLRGEHWTTLETRTDLTTMIAQAVADGADFIVVDCLTLWASNMTMEETADFDQQEFQLLNLIPELTIPIVFVTNEVGSGIVPADPITRQFRDTAGRVNQQVAAIVDRVILTVSGIPVTIK